MNLWRTTTQVACALLLIASQPIASQLNAQPRRGPDPFFDTLREIHYDNPDNEILEVLRHEIVREAIGLKTEDWNAVRQNIRESMESVFKLRNELRKQQPQLSQTQLKQKLVETMQPYQEKNFQLLKERSDFQRLIGVYVQTRNFRSAATNIVAKEIGLEGNALIEFREKKAELWHQKMEEMRRKLGDNIRNPGDNQRGPSNLLFEKAEKDIELALKRELTHDQRQKLEALKGELIELPEAKRPGPPNRGSEGRGRDNRGPSPKDCPDCECPPF